MLAAAMMKALMMSALVLGLTQGNFLPSCGGCGSSFGSCGCGGGGDSGTLVKASVVPLSLVPVSLGVGGGHQHQQAASHPPVFGQDVYLNKAAVPTVNYASSGSVCGGCGSSCGGSCGGGGAFELDTSGAWAAAPAPVVSYKSAPAVSFASGPAVSYVSSPVVKHASGSVCGSCGSNCGGSCGGIVIGHQAPSFQHFHAGPVLGHGHGHLPPPPPPLFKHGYGHGYGHGPAPGHGHKGGEIVEITKTRTFRFPHSSKPAPPCVC